jgi:diadenosine tetraphosphate (Ap4A) HIT family hydrolase
MSYAIPIMIIFETENFRVVAPEKPHVDRADGGHIKIEPKVPVEDRTKLSPALAKEFMMLTMAAGEAMTIALQKRGIDIGRINYQDMGNWVSTFHMQIYGRARSARIQKFGEAVLLPQRSTGFYDSFKPLNKEDVAAIKEEIERLMQTEKYRNF